jgi:basic membrane lipoprotein Med (substrate-binding protein (PBP1-ABC) superfamily)
MSRKIYIAGPMRGLPFNNYPKFDRIAAELRQKGWDVVNPTEIGATVGTIEQLNNDKKLLDVVLYKEMSALAQCDAIYLLTGWERSAGAKTELLNALAADLEIIPERIPAP